MNDQFVVQNQPKKITQALDKMSTDYSFIVDVSSADYIYYGWTRVGRLAETTGAIWAIFRIAISSDVYSSGWADGNTNNDNVWSDRASLSYS